MAIVVNGVKDCVPFVPDPSLFPTVYQQDAGDHCNSMATIHGSSRDTHHASSLFNSYDATLSYNLGPSNYPQQQFTGLDAAKQATSDIASRPTPSVSPSSFSQSYDQPPSTMSSTSGASAHSTGSSAHGSPHITSAHQLPYHNKWSDSFHGLGIGPSIVTNDAGLHENFQVPNFEQDVALHEHNYQGFVGECEASPLSMPFWQGVRSHYTSPLQESDLVFSQSPRLAKYFSGTQDTFTNTTRGDLRTRLITESATPSTTSAENIDTVQPDVPLVDGRCQSKTDLSPQPAAALSNAPPLKEEVTSTVPLGHWSTFVSFKEDRSLVSQDPLFNQSSGRVVAPLQLSCWLSFNILCLASLFLGCFSLECLYCLHEFREADSYLDIRPLTHPTL